MPGNQTRKRGQGRRTRKNRNVTVTKKVANKNRAILKLQKQVTSIRRKTAVSWQYSQYTFPVVDSSVGNTQAPKIYSLIDPEHWAPVFQSSTATDLAPKYFGRRINLDLNLSVESSGLIEAQMFYYKIYLVSFKNEAAAETLSRTSQLTTMTLGKDYTSASVGSTLAPALWRLNPAIYKVHASRSGMIGTVPYAQTISTEPLQNVSVLGNAQKIHRINIPWRHQLKGTNQEGPTQTASWKNLAMGQVEHNDRLYLVAFANGHGSATLWMSFNTTIYGKTAA